MKNHERRVGTVSRGIRCPIIRQGDNLAEIVTESVLEAAKEERFEIRDRDVISVTESVVARSQGNYAPVSAIAEDVRTKTGGGTVGVTTGVGCGLGVVGAGGVTAVAIGAVCAGVTGV